MAIEGDEEWSGREPGLNGFGRRESVSAGRRAKCRMIGSSSTPGIGSIPHSFSRKRPFQTGMTNGREARPAV